MDPLYIVRKHVAPYVGESGKNESDPEVLEAINEARRIIYPVGDWQDTVATLCIEVCNGTITLPPWAETVRGAFMGRQRLDVESEWYSQVIGDSYTSFCGPDISGKLIEMGSRYATFRPYNLNFRLKVVGTHPDDKGVELTFHAVSEYGEHLLLTRIIGEPWEPVLTGPKGDGWIISISACNKPVTQGRVHLYIHDPVRNLHALCAIYEPGDVNPSMRRYKVPASDRGQVFAKVKKKFVELTDDRQLVDIHTDALIHLLQAITNRRNRDAQGYATQVQAAKNLLDREIQNEQPNRTHTFRMSSAFQLENLGFES